MEGTLITPPLPPTPTELCVYIKAQPYCGKWRPFPERCSGPMKGRLPPQHNMHAILTAIVPTSTTIAMATFLPLLTHHPHPAPLPSFGNVVFPALTVKARCDVFHRQTGNQRCPQTTSSCFLYSSACPPYTPFLSVCTLLSLIHCSQRGP